MAPWKITISPDMPDTFQVSLVSCRKTGRVLFLETGKDFVDLLLIFLLLPVGAIIHILSEGPVKAKHLGGISSIFESENNLESSFSNLDVKQTLEEPKAAAGGTCMSIGLLQGANAPNPSFEINLPEVYYRCDSGRCNNLSSKSGSRCEKCSIPHPLVISNYPFPITLSTRRRPKTYTYSTAMTVLLQYLEELQAAIVGVEDPVEEASSSTGQGFVNENITYMAPTVWRSRLPRRFEASNSSTN